MRPSRRTVSRDTRVLFVIVVASIGMLWALARLRFPDRVRPVAPVLAQLAPSSAFDDMARTVARVADHVESLIVGVAAHVPKGATLTRSALRFRGDLAVLLIGESSRSQEPAPALVDALEIGRDRASRLAVVRLPPADASALAAWAPRRLSTPRFLIAARATPTGLSVRPLFVASMRPIVTPIWLDPIWEFQDAADVAPGTFVFTVDGALAGLVIEREGRPALVPAETVIARAERLASESQSRPGVLGVEVGPLTRSIAAATGALAGVVVTWVDREGPAAQALQIADVVESIDGSPATTIEHWTARVARVSEGESVALRVHRASGTHDVRLTASAPPVPPATSRRDVGLALQTIRGVGAAIVQVDADSPAALEGLRTGDVITLVGDLEAPTASQASRAFATWSDERPLIVAFEREQTHHLIALERTW